MLLAPDLPSGLLTSLSGARSRAAAGHQGRATIGAEKCGGLAAATKLRKFEELSSSRSGARRRGDRGRDLPARSRRLSAGEIAAAIYELLDELEGSGQTRH